MPTLPASGRNTRASFNVSFLAAGGDNASTQLAYNELTVTGTELAAFRDAIGNMSNAAVWKTTDSSYVEVSKTNVNPLDESYSDAGTKAVMVFQNDTLDQLTIAIPAPDESLFGSDGVGMLAPGSSTLVNAAVNAILAIINAPLTVGGDAGTYAFLRGYRSRNSRVTPRPRTARSSIEPGAGVNPPDAPGT